MNDEIKVHVVDMGRKYLYMRYLDPITGKQIARSTKKTKHSDALGEAAVWEDKLRSGAYKPASKVTWADFRERYETDAFPDLAESTQQLLLYLFRFVQNTIELKRLTDLNSEKLQYLVRIWRDEKKLSEQTIKANLAHLRAGLNWAKSQKMLTALPDFPAIKRAKRSKMMKGRPISGEEFDRMIAAIPKVVKFADDVPKIERLLWGLWWGGLRLGEALDLWWDREDRMHVVLTEEYPMLRIHGDQEKGGQDRLLPITPEFARFLLETPEAERKGHVFKLRGRYKNRMSLRISAIGREAGIKVNTDPRTQRVKYASAHDLRRSFGERWAARVMPQQLMELMRHEDIQTTMRYYVGRNAQSTAAMLWKLDSGNTAGNSDQKTAKNPA